MVKNKQMKRDSWKDVALIFRKEKRIKNVIVVAELLLVIQLISS